MLEVISNKFGCGGEDRLVGVDRVGRFNVVYINTLESHFNSTYLFGNGNGMSKIKMHVWSSQATLKCIDLKHRATCCWCICCFSRYGMYFQGSSQCSVNMTSNQWCSTIESQHGWTTTTHKKTSDVTRHDMEATRNLCGRCQLVCCVGKCIDPAKKFFLDATLCLRMRIQVRRNHDGFYFNPLDARRRRA